MSRGNGFSSRLEVGRQIAEGACCPACRQPVRADSPVGADLWYCVKCRVWWGFALVASETEPPHRTADRIQTRAHMRDVSENELATFRTTYTTPRYSVATAR